MFWPSTFKLILEKTDNPFLTFLRIKSLAENLQYVGLGEESPFLKKYYEESNFKEKRR